MAKKTAQLTMIVAFVVISSIALSGMFAITGSTKPTNVYTAQFDNAICTVVKDDFSITGISGVDHTTQGALLSEGIWFAAAYSSSTIRTEFTCNVNTKKCSVVVNTKDHSGAFVGICPLDVDVRTKDDITNKCRLSHEICDGMIFCGADQYSVDFNNNQNFYSNNEKFVVLSGSNTNPGDITIHVKADVYGLWATSADNYLTIAQGTCNLNNMFEDVVMTPTDVLDTDIQNSVVRFDGTVNIFSQLVKVYETTRIVQLSSGEWVYIKNIMNGVGQVCPLHKTTDGKTITDCGREQRAESEIICIPFALDGERQCSEDGSEWVGELTCTWWGGGVPSGYITVGNELCLAKCENGELVYHSCVTIQDCQAGFVFDPDKNACVKLGAIPPAPPVNETDEACKLNAECDDNLWWTYDTCDRTFWQELRNQEGLCKHMDLRAVLIIGLGVLLTGLLMVGMSFKK